MATPKGHKKVMIVDDEPRVVNLVREVLLATGFDVIAAFSGDSAIELAALEQPDLILLDIILPGEMDGYQVAYAVSTATSACSCAPMPTSRHWVGMRRAGQSRRSRAGRAPSRCRGRGRCHVRR